MDVPVIAVFLIRLITAACFLFVFVGNGDGVSCPNIAIVFEHFEGELIISIVFG